MAPRTGYAFVDWSCGLFKRSVALEKVSGNLLVGWFDHYGNTDVWRCSWNANRRDFPMEWLAFDLYARIVRNGRGISSRCPSGSWQTNEDACD